MSTTPYRVVRWQEDERGYNRSELREYPDGTLEMVRLRSRVGGGYYVDESISLPPENPPLGPR